MGVASGPSSACQVSLVTTPLSGRLAVAYTEMYIGFLAAEAGSDDDCASTEDASQ